MKAVKTFAIFIYAPDSHNIPYLEWRDKLDARTQATIKGRLKRIQLGSFGDSKHLDDGIWELRIHYGPGYRIYFGRQGTSIVILLLGGDKRSQTRDIAKAKRYWIEYQKSKRGLPYD
jgi:putative addiction module killer protein